MHFATFAGGESEAVEPLVRLSEAKARVERAAEAEDAKEQGGVRVIGEWWEEGGFGVVDIGGGGLIKLRD